MRFELKLYHCTTGRPMSVPLDLDGVTEDWTPEQIGRELSIRLDCARKAKDATPPKAQRWGLSSEINREWILRELTDLEAACAIVRKALDGSMGGASS